MAFHKQLNLALSWVISSRKNIRMRLPEQATELMNLFWAPCIILMKEKVNWCDVKAAVTLSCGTAGKM
jgi:hypothetical protein